VMICFIVISCVSLKNYVSSVGCRVSGVKRQGAWRMARGVRGAMLSFLSSVICRLFTDT